MWHPLKAPEKTSTGKPIMCAGECSLHLKGRTELFGTPIYSGDNSPGLILATGNVGFYLSNKAEEINTYLSRDGGHNWMEVNYFVNILFYEN